MGKRSTSTEGTRSTDNRQRDNQNPDRPPVDPTDPNTPDPFDPFKTAHLADGGAVIQDATELAFESQLAETLPGPATPTTPSPSAPTPGPATSPEPESISSGTSVDPESVTRPSFEPVAPTPGSLIHTVASFINELTPKWSYVIRPAKSNDSVEHHAVREGNSTYALREFTGKYYVYHDPERPHMGVDTDPNEYSEFETAMAAFIEGVDWGTLPPANDDPHIWTYNGYTGTAASLQEYIAGKDNKECGDHYFANTSADYGIHIESYSDHRASASPGETVTIVTITNAADRGAGLPLYRTRLPGQQQAFNFLLTALNAGLSSEIALHDGDFGDSDCIPPIQYLLQNT